MNIRIALCIVLLLAGQACSRNPESRADKTDSTEFVFNEVRWKVKEGNDYLYRDKMLKNLMGSQQLKKLKRDEVLDLLGDPERIDSLYLFYLISQKHIGFLPFATKTMVIKFNPDSTTKWVRIHQ